MFWDELDDRLSKIENDISRMESKFLIRDEAFKKHDERLEQITNWGKKHDERLAKLESAPIKTDNKDYTVAAYFDVLDGWKTIVLFDYPKTNKTYRYVSRGAFGTVTEALKYGDNFHDPAFAFIRTNEYERN